MSKMPQKPDPIELLYAYSNGYFPMAHPERENLIYWHRPKMRGVIPLNEFHVSKNLRRLYRNGPFTFTSNKAFEEVIRACADRESTWISEEIIITYVELYRMGNARSIEVWHKDKLVGGLYGVQMKRAYFGESMFSRESNTSKLALVHLIKCMEDEGLTLLDTQYLNDHLRQFGAIEIPDSKYIDLLEEALSD
jgi:leucyl/phenylalanyl-tRNA---protein transferase